MIASMAAQPDGDSVKISRNLILPMPSYSRKVSRGNVLPHKSNLCATRPNYVTCLASSQRSEVAHICVVFVVCRSTHCVVFLLGNYNI